MMLMKMNNRSSNIIKNNQGIKPATADRQGLQNEFGPLHAQHAHIRTVQLRRAIFADAGHGTEQA